MHGESERHAGREVDCKPKARRGGFFCRRMISGIIAIRLKPIPCRLFMPESSTAPLPLANRWRRFSSMMYEGVLLFAVVYLASYLFDTLTQSRSGMTLRAARQFIVFLAIGVYFVVSWRYSGQTLPMKTWNLRLVDKDGQVPRPGRLALRYLLLWPVPLAAALLVKGLSLATGLGALDLLIILAPFSVFLWTWFDRDRLFLHDRLLGTRLVVVPSRRKTTDKP